MKKEFINEDDICVSINSLIDEIKWKLFFKKYFKNSSRRKMLKKRLRLKYHKKEGYYTGSRIGISLSGYGYLSPMCYHYGNHYTVNDFNEFKKTKCYHDIIGTKNIKK